MKRTLSLLLSTLITFCLPAFGMEKVFYVLHNKNATQQALPILSKHEKAIDIIISQAYHIDSHGTVSGYINEDLLKFSQQHSLKLMAMVTNSMFDSEVAHRFLADPKAQDKALDALLKLCKGQHLYGIQFDFESVAVKDKAALTHFYQSAAALFHLNGFIVSLAVAPGVNNAETLSAYYARMYKVWLGAYDLTALGKIADFITVMTYDQHLGVVTPGPVAGIHWVEEVIKHTLKSVPASKISLGIPAYSHFWYTGLASQGKVRLRSEAISYQEVLSILQKRNAKLQWDNHHQVHFASYEHHWLNQFIYVEDAASLKAKLALVKKYHLRGISFFRIGLEDPDVWKLI